MSLLWGYDSAKCDGEYCPNDCDRCYKAGREIDEIKELEKVSVRVAKPETICGYPVCEACPNYVSGYCTVPMVFSKQISRMLAEKLRELEKRLSELENLATDEILGEK